MNGPTGNPPAPADSTDPVEALLKHLQASASLAHDGPALAAHCQAIEGLMARAQPVLAQRLGASTPPPAMAVVQLDLIENGLKTLREAMVRQQGMVGAALGTLFPAEQGKAYARLGGLRGAALDGTAGSRISNQTSLKA